MAKDKFSLRDMDAELGEGSGSSLPPQKPVSSPVQSSVHGRPRMVSQSFNLSLPTSQREITTRLMELVPEECFPSTQNKRVQSLLSFADPRIDSLRKNIREEGQRDPVLARPVKTEEGIRYEVIYGSTRLFVLNDLCLNDPTWRLKAWVGDVPDVDVAKLAKGENENRRDISAWEEARHLAQVVSDNPGKSLEFTAEMQGISKTSLLNYLEVARLPEVLIRCLPSPQDITVNSGVQIAKVLKPLSQEELGRLIAGLGTSSYTTSAGLLKAIQSVLQQAKVAESPIKKTRPLTIKDNQGRVKARVSAHRSNAGQYKIDVFELTDAQAEALVSNLRKSLL